MSLVFAVLMETFHHTLRTQHNIIAFAAAVPSAVLLGEDDPWSSFYCLLMVFAVGKELVGSRLLCCSYNTFSSVSFAVFSCSLLWDFLFSCCWLLPSCFVGLCCG